MREPTEAELRAYAFARIDAGRAMKVADEGTSGDDDRVARQMIYEGAAIICALEERTPQRWGKAAEAMRVSGDMGNEWAAYLAGDKV